MRPRARGHLVDGNSLGRLDVQELPGNPEHQPASPPVGDVDERVEVAIHQGVGVAPEVAVVVGVGEARRGDLGPAGEIDLSSSISFSVSGSSMAEFVILIFAHQDSSKGCLRPCGSPPRMNGPTSIRKQEQLDSFRRTGLPRRIESSSISASRRPFFSAIGLDFPACCFGLLLRNPNKTLLRSIEGLPSSAEDPCSSNRLKIFCDVVRWASFSRGAAENGISQSSASQAVHQLEVRLGVKLIDRSKRPLVLDAAGQGLLRRLQGPGRSLSRAREPGQGAGRRRIRWWERSAWPRSIRSGLHHMSQYVKDLRGASSRGRTSGSSTCTRAACSSA